MKSKGPEILPCLENVLFNVAYFHNTLPNLLGTIWVHEIKFY